MRKMIIKRENIESYDVDSIIPLSILMILGKFLPVDSKELFECSDMDFSKFSLVF